MAENKQMLMSEQIYNKSYVSAARKQRAIFSIRQNKITKIHQNKTKKFIKIKLQENDSNSCGVLFFYFESGHNYTNNSISYYSQHNGTLGSNGALDIWILGTELWALDQAETCFGQVLHHK